ncbi:uncharacterized protein LOC123874264 [Maniola jurtina]|uniref:uncharacterized protein LOC123874264 n=1 Tax=Maniola jurtina TaxID=191418 RepID=UPI001E68FA4F|nr:uncharacterized protein LOC123874264 [Maniola jurtina]
MDSNENNNDSVSVPDLDSIHVKVESVEKCENPEAVKETIHLKLRKINSTFEKKLQDIQLNHKRKVAESSDVVMDNEDSNDSVKRRRYSDSQNEVAMSNNSESVAEKQIYTLLLTNSQGNWSSKEVINYVKDECGVHISSINDSREDNTKEDFQIRLRFETKKHLHQVLKKLKEKEIEGKLNVQLMDSVKDEVESDAESDTTVQLEPNESENPQAEESTGPSKPKQNVTSDSNDYHIREDYLDSLGITPPLTNWVTVTNFRCDKSELKEVLELAGKVLICSVCMNSTKYANVMYSHPLEAVQAVSMLNGQQYYGKNLKVKINNTIENKTLLPKGLVEVGPGLGKYGKPLPDIGDQYKKFLKGKTSNLDACLFQSSFLKKIGITIDEEVAKFVRSITTPSSQNSQNDTDSERNESPIDKDNIQKSESGPFRQKPGSNIPVLRPQNKIPPRPVILQSSNVPPNPMQQMQGPIRGPMPSPVMGPRIPGPMQMGPGSRPGFPMVNPGPMYPSCPPVPGIESGNDPSKNVNGMSGPRFRGPMPGPMSPMLGPRGPMVGPNRFPGPGPMMGPRPGPAMGPHGPMAMPNGPIRPNMPFWSNVRMFKGPDPVMVQITNLPPTTNFVNLGQKLTELGHVVFLELTTPGCANVRFASPADVERCLQNYRQVMG